MYGIIPEQRERRQLAVPLTSCFGGTLLNGQLPMNSPSRARFAVAKKWLLKTVQSSSRDYSAALMRSTSVVSVLIDFNSIVHF